jgi:hypothetical protein
MAKNNNVGVYRFPKKETILAHIEANPGVFAKQVANALQCDSFWLDNILAVMLIDMSLVKRGHRFYIYGTKVENKKEKENMAKRTVITKTVTELKHELLEKEDLLEAVKGEVSTLKKAIAKLEARAPKSGPAPNLPGSEQIIGFLQKNPGSGRGAVAKALGLEPTWVSSTLGLMRQYAMVFSQGAGRDVVWFASANNTTTEVELVDSEVNPEAETVAA